MSFRYRRRREDNSVDDWLMTYADMITLILCFFAIFLSISVPKKDAFKQMRSKVMEQFAVDDPAGMDSPRIDPGDAPPVQGSQYITPEIPRGLPPDKAPLTGLPSIVGSLNDNDDNPPPKKTDEKPGDRISSIEMNSASSFAAGSATLSDEGKKALDAVLMIVQSDKFKDFTITIEGHTDDSPINTLQFPSNWELSTGRAAAVARYFLEHGVSAQRLRASGYADTFPKVPNRDAAGKPIPANQAQNRRVVIKMEKIEKQGKNSQ
jgi:chemotaxis protein MotB